jgi:hypothetical protein
MGPSDLFLAFICSYFALCALFLLLVWHLKNKEE